ncbi:MAG: formimidoylglutamate deiminase [Gammaproteobacteria bacterium]|jgi:formimidoylglutamate deiminase
MLRFSLNRRKINTAQFSQDMNVTSNNIVWAKSALLSDGWANHVEITIDPQGDIVQILTDQDYQQGDRVGLLIPGVPNVHSHAHQRAMSGLAERAGQSGDAAQDSFWTWRKVMYHYLERIQPEHLKAISAQLYLEMLKAGYTNVGEFQYLHHQSDGKPFDDRSEMSQQCMQAASEVGIGFTALPVLYQYGGFGSQPSLDGQKRFLNNADEFGEIVLALQNSCRDNKNNSVGIAAHSLRAVDQSLLAEVINNLGVDNLAAIHIHIAEQTKEVDDCLAWSGQRPVEWLLERFDVNQQWCLIHATHMTHQETLDMAQSGAIAGLCPTTEANLGDGFFNAQEYVKAGGQWAIGSDSHISIDPVEELRWFEYGVRLQTRGRSLMVSEQMKNTGRNLLDQALLGAESACGRQIGKLGVGYRADMLVLDDQHPRLYGRHEDDLIDSWIFSGNENLVNRVYVGGRLVIKDGQHPQEQEISEQYRQTLDALAN